MQLDAEWHERLVFNKKAAIGQVLTDVMGKKFGQQIEMGQVASSDRPDSRLASSPASSWSSTEIEKKYLKYTVIYGIIKEKADFSICFVITNHT